MGTDSTESRRGAGPEAGRPCRVAEADLPEELSHGPSRRFLSEQGLPAAVADLDLTVLHKGRLEPLTRWEGGEVVGDGRLLVLGETDYCGSRVVLDGVTGEVRLAARAGAAHRERTGRALRHDPGRSALLPSDLLASDLTALAGLLHAAESVSQAARQADAFGHRRGPGVVAEVIDAAERRMRAADPQLFAADSPPPHWGTSLLVRSLCWGARPGLPGALAYEFGPDLVEELAELDGEGRVRRYRPEEIPDGLTHEPTRRLLTELGLPLDCQLFCAFDEPLRTMVEAHPDAFDEPAEPSKGPGAAAGRAYQRDHIAVGWWPHDLVIALDGATGRLELPEWYDEGGPAAYLNRDLSALLYALWTYERLRAEWRRWDCGVGRDTWQVFDPLALLHSRVDEMVKAVDPEAFRSPHHSWRLLAEDPYTGGLLSN
ncbi:SUKH-4 family immunity protein [Streptomyces sp. NPDC001970]